MIDTLTYYFVAERYVDKVEDGYEECGTLLYAGESVCDACGVIGRWNCDGQQRRAFLICWDIAAGVRSCCVYGPTDPAFETAIMGGYLPEIVKAVVCEALTAIAVGPHARLMADEGYEAGTGGVKRKVKKL